MKIKGTEYESFWLSLAHNFKTGTEIVTEHIDSKLVVEDFYWGDYGWVCKHEVYTVLEGEEFEIAINHFKFLYKYGLLD